jgi:two-component system sensor histidine kinase KdpD
LRRRTDVKADSPRRLWLWAAWFGALLAVAGVLLLLLVVLGGSAAGGRALGIALAGAAFLVFDVWFLPPYNTLRINDPFDWIVLLTFLVTGIVGAQLLERRRSEDEVVQLRAIAEEEAETLRRTDRLKDALLASVSHDLRTPLTTIKGIANEIARGGDPTRAYVIEEEADRLTAIVADLLDLSQLAAGEMVVRATVNTADDVVGAALQRVESAFSERRIGTVLEGEWTQLVGRFDFVHTMRILTNLIENAAKYAPPDAAITLRVSREGGVLRFAVEDGGSGIAEDERERIFEPFVRGERATRGIRGTGLGLSIARRLAEVQGGRLDYFPSDARPSRFVLSLPAADMTLE